MAPFFLDATPRIELGMEVLQTSALPLGYVASVTEFYDPGDVAGIQGRPRAAGVRGSGRERSHGGPLPRAHREHADLGFTRPSAGARSHGARDRDPGRGPRVASFRSERANAGAGIPGRTLRGPRSGG